MNARVDERRSRMAHRLRSTILTLAGVLLAHAAIYVDTYGTGPGLAEAMTRTGHDGWWLVAALVVLLAGGAVLLGTLRSWSMLEGSAAGERRAGQPAWWPEFRGLTRRLVPSITLVYLLQENVENLLTRGHLAGLEPLAIGLAPALLVLAGVALALSALGALIRWRIAGLRWQIDHAGRTRVSLAAASWAPRWQAIGALAPRERLLVRRDAGRAPPGFLAA